MLTPLWSVGTITMSEQSVFRQRWILWAGIISSPGRKQFRLEISRAKKSTRSKDGANTYWRHCLVAGISVCVYCNPVTYTTTVARRLLEGRTQTSSKNERSPNNCVESVFSLSLVSKRVKSWPVSVTIVNLEETELRERTSTGSSFPKLTFSPVMKNISSTLPEGSGRVMSMTLSKILVS